jgi:hypothetical protein
MDSEEEQSAEERWEAHVEEFGRLIYGFAELVPTGEEEWKSATTQIVAAAETHEEFERLAREAIVSQGGEPISIEYVERLLDKIPLYPEMLALAAEAVESGGPAVGVWHLFGADDADETEEETRQFEEVRSAGSLVWVIGQLDETCGFLLDFSDELVLLHTVIPYVVALDTHRVIDRSEVTRIEPANDGFIMPALELKGEHPVDVGAPLEDWPTFLRWAADATTLIALKEERRRPSNKLLGAIKSVDANELTLRGLSVQAEWTDDIRHEIANITWVEFGGAYLTALSLVAGPDPQRDK